MDQTTGRLSLNSQKSDETVVENIDELRARCRELAWTRYEAAIEHVLGSKCEDDGCGVACCQFVRRRLAHIRVCASARGCPTCRGFTAYFASHAERCSSPGCGILPLCTRLKARLREVARQRARDDMLFAKRFGEMSIEKPQHNKKEEEEDLSSD